MNKQVAKHGSPPKKRQAKRIICYNILIYYSAIYYDILQKTMIYYNLPYDTIIYYDRRCSTLEDTIIYQNRKKYPIMSPTSGQ